MVKTDTQQESRTCRRTWSGTRHSDDAPATSENRKKIEIANARIISSPERRDHAILGDVPAPIAQQLSEIFSPDQFAAIQLVLLAGLAFAAFRFVSRSQRESQFRTDAFHRPRLKPKHHDRKRQEREERRVLLGGFSFTGLPHEILGIAKDAGEFEIRRAHRALIKRFHPDKIGQQGSREWHDAQKIAEAVNTARDDMLRALPK